MSYRNGKLQCDMDYSCTCPVEMIDEKGFAYCAHHGKQRKQYRSCRKLRPWEIDWLNHGKALPSYRPISKAEAARRELQRAQARLCEQCPAGDLSTNAGEHSDECLAMQEALERQP